jgi:hypothetical protein
MVQGPGDVAPLVWTFALDVFLDSPQNIAIEFSILVEQIPYARCL